MATTIKVENGRITANYKTAAGENLSELLSYTRYNITDSAESISAYSEEAGSEVTRSKAGIANSIVRVAQNLTTLTTNTYQNTKISYDAKIEGTVE